MSRMFKKIISVMLVAVMVFGTAPLAGFISFDLPEINLFSTKAEAATYSGNCGDNLTWKYVEATDTLTISGTGSMYDYTGFNRPWEDHSSKIQSVIIGNGVTSIGKWAFSYCDSIESVTIPNSVTIIGWGAFFSCDGLESIAFGNAITHIGEFAFSECISLESITIPDSVTKISDYAFRLCLSLKNIVIGKGVTSIGTEAFRSCETLVSITVDSTNTAYSSDEYGVLFNKNKTELIQYPTGNNRTNYIIPDSVISIGDYAFSFCKNLTNITIPTSVISIEKWAFGHCDNLINITIPDNVTSIGEQVFYDCDSLTSVIVGNGVTSIDVWSFGNCKKLTSIKLSDNLTSIGYSAFYDCSALESITIPNSVTNIGEYVFYNCDNLANVYYKGTEEQWKTVEIGQLNDALTNATIHYTKVNVEPITVTVNVYSTIDGSVAQFKEYGITISSDDEYAPLPNNTYSITNNLGCVSFPIEFTEDDLEGLSSKTFIYDLTICSVNGKKYDFIPETQQVKITITNANGELSQTVGEDEYRFDGYSYYDYTVTLVWDDHDNVCGVRPESLDLTLVSHLGDVSIPFTLNKDNRWSVVLSVRNVNDDDYFYRYSVEGLDSDVGYEYNAYSNNDTSMLLTASLPVCSVTFNTQYGTTPEKQYIIKNSLATEPETPTNLCYVFEGWYKNEECTEGMEWNFETDKVTQKTTLYAKWAVKLIDITLKTEYGVLQAGGNSKELFLQGLLLV